MNDDLDQLAVEHFDQHEWVASPSSTVFRKRYFLSGDREKGAVSSIVRYAPGSRFPTHEHPEGEEILVLEGTFSDEHGDFPAGTYFLNPPGTSHAPFSVEGCIIFVRLRQYAGDGLPHVCIDTNARDGVRRDGASVLQLATHDGRLTQLIRLKAGSRVALEGFVEIFVVRGMVSDAEHELHTWSWIRYPHGARTIEAAEDATLLVRSEAR